MKSTGNIDFIVRGKISDLEISPNHISVSLLNSFSKDISDLLNTIQEAKKEQIIVSIEEGSFKIKAAMFMAAINIINAEIKTLQETNDLNSINEKRGLIYRKILTPIIKAEMTNISRVYYKIEHFDYGNSGCKYFPKKETINLFS